MTTNELIKKYNYAKDKEGFWAKRTLVKYVPYEKKIVHCEKILESTSKIKSNDIEVYKQNSPIKYMLFTLMLIDLYTDVDIDENKLFDEFNILDENNLLSSLIKLSIPSKELDTFSDLLDMVYEDYYQNERNIINKLDAIMMLLNNINV